MITEQRRGGTAPTDISVTAGIGLYITEDDASTAGPICPDSADQERVVKRHEGV
jgi:hypothetical protein